MTVEELAAQLDIARAELARMRDEADTTRRWLKRKHVQELAAVELPIVAAETRLREAIDAAVLHVVPTQARRETFGRTTIYYTPTREECEVALAVGGEFVIVHGFSVWRCKLCGAPGAGGLHCMGCGRSADVARFAEAP